MLWFLVLHQWTLLGLDTEGWQVPVHLSCIGNLLTNIEDCHPKQFSEIASVEGKVVNSNRFKLYPQLGVKFESVNSQSTQCDHVTRQNKGTFWRSKNNTRAQFIPKSMKRDKKQFDDDEKLSLKNGWPKKGIKTYFKPWTLPDILIIANFQHTASMMPNTLVPQFHNDFHREVILNFFAQNVQEREFIEYLYRKFIF